MKFTVRHSVTVHGGEAMPPTSRVALVATAMPHAAPRAALSSAALGSVLYAFYACAAHVLSELQFHGFEMANPLSALSRQILQLHLSYVLFFEAFSFDVLSWCRCWYHQVAAAMHNMTIQREVERQIF